MRVLARRSLGDLFNFFNSIIGAIAYFLVGFLLSLLTRQHSFDLGWILVIFLISRGVSHRFERGKPRPRDYVTLYWPAIPGFALEWISDLTLRNFRLHGSPLMLQHFAIFSSLYLGLIIVLTLCLRFGFGINELAPSDEAIWRNMLRLGAIGSALSLAFGTIVILFKESVEPSTQQKMLESWFYQVSLIIYGLMTMKMTLPLILKRLRAAI